MDSPSSPLVLYLGDDDDDNDNNYNYHRQNSYVETNMSLSKVSSSSNMNNRRKKRKLTNTDVRVDPSVANWSKRQRNDHCQQQQSSRNFIDADSDPEPILLDPDEYIIEEPDPPQFCSFDWTIEQQPQPKPQTPIQSRRRPLPPLLPSHSIQATRISTTANSTMNNSVQRSFAKPDSVPITNSANHFVQPPRKTIATPITKPSQTFSSLSLPKPATSFCRPNVQRGRPVKNSRISYTNSTSPSLPIRRPTEKTITSPPQKPSQPSSSSPSSSSTSTIITSSSINDSTPAIRRQILNGTGLFSAFHDSKYYQCNICKFKSVTSSTLLQHLFTHMFFCDQCPFYAYSHFNLSQHMFEKHICNLNENANDSENPKSFDLLYVTRCSDGTFALCMDSSSHKVSTNDQRLIISSATPSNQQQNKPAKKKNSKLKESSNEDENDAAVVSEKSHTNHRLLKHSKGKGKQNQTYVLMKHRRCYLMKKNSRLHSLTLEYNICREHTIRQMCLTQNILKQRKFLAKLHSTQFIDDIAICLRTIVNRIVNSEENSDQSSPICTLPNNILSSILSSENLKTLTDSLKLTNKHEQYREQNELYEKEHDLHESRKHIFIISSPERNSNDQAIISSLHSSLTNGDSIFTQTKIDKSSIRYDSTPRFLKGNSNTAPSQSNNSTMMNVKKKQPTTTQVAPPKLVPVPLRTVIPKPPSITPSHPLVSPIMDRNNNSVTSLKSKISTTKDSSVIILD
ncbi:unnamed protein product [Rotaria magnacalcarata]|uniref:C2H2-type domain-containing protein n=3 Tax=Rotaria magnacalcarata TaxID=392030 RepID=A0A816FZ51_9BILA|nr:unnamed protein product [Rotaria magnacalcarata]